MTAPRNARRAAERGFVLVGVVMMVMALTIIGISLYSLSGYETQFFSRTLFDRQALYRASGGIELAKALLSEQLPDYRLSNVTRAIGREGIVSAIAWQDSPPDSSGPIDWGQEVHVRIGVQEFGATRTVEATFNGSTEESPYHKVFTSSTSISTLHENNNRPTILVGDLWQHIGSSADTAWVFDLDDDSRTRFVAGEPPTPRSAQFLTAHGPGTLAGMTGSPSTPGPGNTTITMDTGSDTGIGYFRTNTDPLTDHYVTMSPYFDFYSQRNVTVRVRGTAVWLVPRGLQIEGDFTVERLPGANAARLVLVIGPNERYIAPAPFLPAGDESHYGPIFEKSIWITSSNTCMFIASHGTARISRAYNAGPQAVAGAISVFANRIEFQGPEYHDPRRDMTLAYAPWMATLADQLYQAGCLPGWNGTSTGEWTLVAGSWTSSPGLP